jgi:DNA polymerase
MADFFDQICEVLAENARKYPGRTVNDDAVKEFFSEIEKPSAPPVPSAAAVETVEEKPELPPSAAAPEAVYAGGDLEKLAAAMQNCRRCHLADKRTHVVFGEGDPQAKLMFVGEAPGMDEDISGRPFVGKAGQLLDKMINAMQFSREEVYIANVVKCRPVGNRSPAPDEISKCIGCLHRQIELIRPEVIVVLGAVAAKALLATEDGISRMRGKWCSFENIPVMPTFHPAFLLRQESAKKEAWQDLQQVMARFGKFHRGKR